MSGAARPPPSASTPGCLAAAGPRGAAPTRPRFHTGHQQADPSPWPGSASPARPPPPHPLPPSCAPRQPSPRPEGAAGRTCGALATRETPAPIHRRPSGPPPRLSRTGRQARASSRRWRLSLGSRGPATWTGAPPSAKGPDADPRRPLPARTVVPPPIASAARQAQRGVGG